MRIDIREMPKDAGNKAEEWPRSKCHEGPCVLPRKHNCRLKLAATRHSESSSCTNRLGIYHSDLAIASRKHSRTIRIAEQQLPAPQFPTHAHIHPPYNHTPTDDQPSTDKMSQPMNFSIPDDLKKYLADLDAFIETTILPLQHKDDNNRFFDHRREHSRTDWDAGGLPRKEWEDLLSESRRLADEAGFYRLSLPKKYGGQNSEDGRGSNLWMAVIREHLAAKGLGLFNDLQNEHSMVGNFPDVIMLMNFGSEKQKAELIPARLRGEFRMTFGLTEPGHGSDATHMATKGVPERRNGVDGWLLNGHKKWQTGMHHATHCSIFARTSGKDGEVRGISCFIVPRDTPGLKAESYEW